MSDTKTNQPLFENAVQDYLESCSSARLSKNIAMGVPEFEIRFGQKIPISKIDYDNVVRELQIHKWRTDNIDGAQYLRISTEFYDSSSTSGSAGGGAGRTQNSYRMSNIRAEIVGTDMVEIYCKTNSLEALKSTPAAHKKLKFTQKKSTPRAIGPTINGTPLPFIDYTDFNFRISSQFELGFPVTSDDDRIRKITNDWNTARKHFRSINRVRFHHPDSLVFVDLSIVKSNKTYTSNNKKKSIPIPCQTIQEAGVFHNAEHYEIELELNNEKITELADRSPISRPKLVQNIIDEIRKVIRIVLSGLQGTPYPIAYSEQDAILKEYMLCIHNSHEKSEEELEEEVRNIRPYFLGPSSKTLQMINVLPDQNPVIPSILSNYTVTEKADGERALLYISKKGKLYMIQTNLKVVFTGAMTENKEYFDSLIDGEYIAYGKRESNDRVFLHLFAAFDIYFIGSRKITSVRELAFCTMDETADDTKFRLPLLENCIQHLKVQSLSNQKQNPVCMFQVKCKTFYMSGPLAPSAPSATIFEGAEMIWNRRDTFEYEIDGLIFTPMNTGVGSDAAGKAHELGKKITWDRSFKWKPPHYNTIDFLVSVQKDKQGKDIIRNKILTDEHNELTSRIQYKTLILKCGFDEKRHKFVNAFSDVLLNRVSDQKGTKNQTIDDDETNTGSGGFVPGKGYQPVAFQPTSPFDQDACFCNIVLEQGSSLSDQGQGIMRTKEDDVFQENMIVEFSYDREVLEKDTAWKWVPLRVRYDKTSELRAGKNNFGNDFTVANDNWHSIHFPITEKMIMGQESPNEFAVDDTVYYNRQEKDSRETQALRDFHNLFVKRFLIEKIGKYLQEKVHIGNPILMDYAVGKAGDLSKWIRAGIAFVLGIDISKDNIINAKDGACVRYLGMRKQNPDMRLRAIFLHGNSGKNLLTTQKAFYTNQEKEVMKAVFGHGSAKEKPIAREYMGIARDGFHISSCQFAMHYFFASLDTLHSFLRNLSECTRLGGYFTGTCYNGQRVFDLLRNTLEGESVRFDKNGKKIFELTRGYSNAIESFPSNEQSIGMAIQVYQESIDKTFEEYLVNFVFLERVMEDYGFVLLTDSENTSIGLVKTNASFEYLYRTMENQGTRSGSSSASASAKTSDYGKALEMTKEEKTISFLNQYFIFKKARNITADRLDKLYEKHVAKSGDEDEDEDKDQVAVKALLSEKTGTKSFLRKIPDKKIVLSIEKYSPIKEEEEDILPLVLEEKDGVEEEKVDEEKDEEEKVVVEDFGEYTEFFQNLKPDVQDKIRKYPQEKQMEILKKLQKPKKKIISIPTKK
jgi:hypothetical protein